MKKYILFFVSTLFAVFTSCSNEDIEVANSVTVKVDPSGVISPFTFEFDAGELESFYSSFKLRTRVLAYNEKGLLVAADTTFLTNYKSLANPSFYLPKGEYTLLAITDVVERENDKTVFELWKLTGEQDISTAKISDAGYIGLQSKILGIASKHVSISSGANSFTLNPTPAGALFCIYYANIHTYSILNTIDLETNRTSDFITFDTNGNYVTIPQNENNEYNWRVGSLDIADYPNSTNIYSYTFVFPMNNVKYRFVGYSSSSAYKLGDEYLADIKAGEEYLFAVDLNDNGEITSEAVILTNNSSSAKKIQASAKKASLTQKRLYKNNIVKEFNVQSSAKLIDLIQK